MNNKESIRSQMRGQRTGLTPPWIEAHSAAVQERLLSLPEFASAESVAIYLASAAEVGTRLILTACRTRGCSLVVPAFDAQCSVYRLCHLEEDTELVAGQWDIMEPSAPRWVSDDAHIDLMVVPGVAFDRGGGRIGYGRGYYDRMTGAMCVQNAWKIGLAFDFQVLDHVPEEAHDVPMDAVVTESRVYKREGA